MTRERIEKAAGEFASQYWYNNHQHTGVMNGFIAGANWAYQHDCIDPDSAELAGYKRGVERAIEVLRATGYFRHLSEAEGFSEAAMEEQFKETMY